MEGYAGPSRVSLGLESGGACWREANIEMLFRDIATAAALDLPRAATHASGTGFLLAANAVVSGELHTDLVEGAEVTVKRTWRWRH